MMLEEKSSRSTLCFARDLFRKPVPTFRDHALGGIALRARDRLLLGALGGLSARRRERLTGLDQALEAREHQRPTVPDGFEHLAAGVEIIVGHRELHLVAHGLELEGDLRRPFATEDLVELDVEGVGEQPERLVFQHMAAIGKRAVAAERYRRAGRPVRLHARAEPVPLGKGTLRQRPPQRLGGGHDIGDVDELRLAYFFASRPRLSSASALRRWRSYLPIQRSAISWIGTGLR